MPILENGTHDQPAQPIAVPLTPPQEPERNGVAIFEILERLEQPVQDPEKSGGTHSAWQTEIAGPVKSTGSVLRSSDDSQSLTPNLPNIQNLGSSRQRPSWSSSHTDLDLRHRYRGERRPSRLYVNGSMPGNTDSTSSAVLSPALTETTVDTDGASASQDGLSAARDTAFWQDRSPSLSDATRYRSREAVVEVSKRPRNLTIDVGTEKPPGNGTYLSNRPRVPRALSTPANLKSPSSAGLSDTRKSRTHSREQSKGRNASASRRILPSPLPASIPMPPLSLATYLQLEISSQRPSTAYIHRSAASEFPYESSSVKMERLLNFIFLPFQLEGVLWFGVLACLDAWLYTFTILPLRMVKSVYILSKSWVNNLLSEMKYIADYVYAGSRRVYYRKRARGSSAVGALSRSSSETQIPTNSKSQNRSRSSKQHRRIKSTPSTLQPDDKADILKGLLIVTTCLILLRFDASRMYHWVRGQSAIKLYVIYNLLEVCDRLLSALGQDVLECLFSRESLERKPNGHSKILRPAWLFLLALGYCVLHAAALFLQVVTLNVAVNSYSNALTTLLMSNQFVEIKGTVFKKFEKENLFQLTCADVVERFQLWHMLMIIASRNIVVERGGITIGFPNYLAAVASPTSSSSPNVTQAVPPLTAASILPRSFMIVPSMLSSVSAYVPPISHVLGPFVIVLGSEMLIDWLKHAYINKFNNTKPIIYSRFLDILAKDYYTNAFGEQNLTKRLGLPVLPLSCLMIRAGFQTYQMFVASWVSSPASNSAATLASIQEHYSTSRPMPTSTAGILVRKMDELLSQLPEALSSSQMTSYFTTTLVVLLMFLVLLVTKLVLGMGLLAFSRARYESMKRREHGGNASHHVEGSRRVGGWGVVEVDEDKRRVIYEDDPAALQVLRAKEAKDRAKRESNKDPAEGLEKVQRFEMVAKRIW